MKSWIGLAVLITSLVCMLHIGLAVAQCIDYADYIHCDSRLDTPGTANGVALSGIYAYVTDTENGLLVIDTANPHFPQIISNVETPGSAWDVAVSGSFAYVADWIAGLQVIDISNPQSPQIVGSVNSIEEAGSVAISGSFAYVTCLYGLHVIDISDSWNPLIVGSVYMPGGGVDVAINNLELSTSAVIIAVTAYLSMR